MFKKIFGRNKDKTPVRSLDRVHDLQKGDAFLIGFDAHPEISNTQFFVQKVTGLDLSEKTGFERRIYHLGNTDDGRELLMWIDAEAGTDRLAFAYSATEQTVNDMIVLDQFAELFAPKRDYLVEVNANQASWENPWLAKQYIEDQSKEVYWLDEDPASITTSDVVSKNEAACDYFRLTDKTREFAIEAFVFSGGKTDVYFICYLPLYKVEELMPAG